MLRSISLALLVILASLAPPASSAAGWNYRIGEPAPGFQLKSLDGKEYSTNDLKGKWVVLGFMTTWCPFCNAAAPHFEKLNQEYAKRGVRVMIVDIEEGGNTVTRWVKKQKLSCPVLLDGKGEVATRYAPPADFAPDLKRQEVMIASFTIIDPEGNVRFLSLNEDTASFDARLTKLRAALDGFLSKQ